MEKQISPTPFSAKLSKLQKRGKYELGIAAPPLFSDKESRKKGDKIANIYWRIS